mgnify:CR=1 FL=1
MVHQQIKDKADDQGPQRSPEAGVKKNGSAAREQGVEPQNFKKTMSITDRKQAIQAACQMAQPNDIILIAGKGHETYQEIQGVRYDFDDMEIVKELLIQLNK